MRRFGPAGNLLLIKSSAREGSALAAQEPAIRLFHTDESVPESGVYRVTHAAHRLPHEVTLLKGQEFPRCGHCAEHVTFEAIRLAPQLRSGIVIYQLPEVIKDDPAA